MSPLTLGKDFNSSKIFKVQYLPFMPNPEVNLFIITSLESKQLVEPKDKNLKRNQIYFSDKQFSDGASDSRNKAS